MIVRQILLCLLLCSGRLVTCPRVSAEACRAGFTLTIIAHAPSWVRTRVDGAARGYSGTMRPGQIIEKRGLNAIVLETGNAGGITVKLNGRELAPLGRSGQPVARRYTSPPTHVAKPVPPVAPLKPIPASKPPTQVQSKPKPVVVLPAPVHPRPNEERLQPHLSLCLSLALLTIPFFVFIWMLVAMRREARLLASLGMTIGSERSIKVVSSQRLSRGRTVYLLEAGGRMFIVATGGVALLREVTISEFSGGRD